MTELCNRRYSRGEGFVRHLRETGLGEFGQRGVNSYLIRISAFAA